jgi:heavy metal efflux system protein
MAFPGVTHASSRIGCAELGGGPEFVSIIEIYVGLKPRAEWTTASDRSTLPEKMEQVLSARLGAAVFSPSR